MRVVVIIILSLLVSYNIYRIYEIKTTTSVSIINGKYRIDSSVISSNKNLSKLLITLEKTQLNERVSMEEVPEIIKKFLNDITDSFEIANPNERWNATDALDYRLIEEKVYDKEKNDSVTSLRSDTNLLPSRKLIYFGTGDGIAILHFYSGGMGVIGHVAIFRFSNGKIDDFWIGGSSIEAFTKEKFIKEARDNIEHYNEVHI